MVSALSSYYVSNIYLHLLLQEVLALVNWMRYRLFPACRHFETPLAKRLFTLHDIVFTVLRTRTHVVPWTHSLESLKKEKKKVMDPFILPGLPVVFVLFNVCQSDHCLPLSTYHFSFSFPGTFFWPSYAAAGKMMKFLNSPFIYRFRQHEWSGDRGQGTGWLAWYTSP